MPCETLCAGYGGTQRLTQIVGKGKAMEMILGSHFVDGKEAYNIGLVNYIVEPGIENQITKQYSSNYYDLMLNNETYRYIFRILALKEIVNNHKKYGFIINVMNFL